MKQRKGFGDKGMLALSMIIWGTLGVFTRQIALSSGALALCRALMAALLLGGYLLLRRQKIDVSSAGRELLLLLASGVAMGVNWVLLFEAYRYTTISLATLSYYFAPVLVTAISPILFRERLTPKQIVCFVMSTLGLCLIIGPAGSGEGRDGIGILFGLGAACLYATVVLMNKSIKTVTGIPRTFLQMLGAILVLAPYVALSGGWQWEGMTDLGWVCLAVVGLVHTGLAYCLYFGSLGHMSGQSAAILSYIDPLVAVLISFFVLGETMTPLQLVGGGLILGFTLYNEI